MQHKVQPNDLAHVNPNILFRHGREAARCDSERVAADLQGGKSVISGAASLPLKSEICVVVDQSHSRPNNEFVLGVSHVPRYSALIYLSINGRTCSANKNQQPLRRQIGKTFPAVHLDLQNWKKSEFLRSAHFTDFWLRDNPENNAKSCRVKTCNIVRSGCSFT